MTDQTADSNSNSRKNLLLSSGKFLLAAVVTGFTILSAYPTVRGLFYADRELSYSVSHNDLFSSPTKLFDLRYRDSTVDNVKSINIRIENNGEQSIKPDEFSEPIQISLDKDCRILDASVISSSPTSALDSFKNSVKKSSDGVSLSPRLMNSGDSITLNILSSSCQNLSTSVRARIEGIREPKQVSINSDKSTRMPLMTKGLLILYVALIAVTSFNIAGLNANLDNSRRNLEDANQLQDSDRSRELIAKIKKNISTGVKGRNWLIGFLVLAVVYVVGVVLIS